MQGGARGNSYDPAPMAYSRRKKRRVAQFADYLRLMRWRPALDAMAPQAGGTRLLRGLFRRRSAVLRAAGRKGAVGGSHFQLTAFSETDFRRDKPGGRWSFPRCAGRRRRTFAGQSLESLGALNLWGLSGGSGQKWQWEPAFDPGSSEPPRFIQFAFLQDRFYLELPKSTLAAAEAQRLLTERHGFYWARKHRDYWWVNADWEAMLKWDPLHKLYLYRDEDAALPWTLACFRGCHKTRSCGFLSHPRKRQYAASTHLRQRSCDSFLDFGKTAGCWRGRVRSGGRDGWADGPLCRKTLESIMWHVYNVGRQSRRTQLLRGEPCLRASG